MVREHVSQCPQCEGANVGQVWYVVNGWQRSITATLSWQPRFDRERRELLRDHFPNRFVGDESEVITALDYFLLQHELRSGKTVVERFVASRPDLPEHERELLLGWRDVVEGIFEVHGRDGDARADALGFI